MWFGGHESDFARFANLADEAPAIHHRPVLAPQPAREVHLGDD
jgi:hypothetical protein